MKIDHEKNNDNCLSSNDADISFIVSFRNGDKKAFDMLVRKYQDRILTLCVRTIGDRSDGEDAAQETFMKING